jgi:succinate dehydrogenase / fumarate reductase, flavoprotein subunit
MALHETITTGVLIIGSGAAGLRAALAASAAGCRVVVVGKRPRDDAHTVLAAGGINAALGTVDPEDSWQQHFADTVNEGYLLGDPRAVEIMVREAPAAVRELAAWGCNFARTPDGELDQRFFGAHKYRRTCYAGDEIGRAILQTVLQRVETEAIPIHEERYVWRLLVSDGRCRGALAFDLATGRRSLYLAGAVVLAAGGHTAVWRRSSSRPGENTGDAMALALDAGCELADMEMVQFHPTGMVTPPEMAGTLVTEAVRGEGGRLFNREGERFMERYDPERLELTTRDQLALAIYTEILEGRGSPHGGVYLDISHRNRDYLLEKLPHMVQQFQNSLNLDIAREPMEVAPTAHYSMGGVVAEAETHATCVPGLFAAGECTAGLHGANRLGGNSLVETIVFGRRAGEAAAALAREYGGPDPDEPALVDAIAAGHIAVDELVSTGGGGGEQVGELREALGELMWQRCGVVRSGDGLRQGLEELVALQEKVASFSLPGVPAGNDYRAVAALLNLKQALAAAEATLRSALERRESRGAHLRADFPEIDANMQLHVVVRLDEHGRQALSTRPVPPVPPELQEWVADAEELEIGQRLLE